MATKKSEGGDKAPARKRAGSSTPKTSAARKTTARKPAAKKAAPAAAKETARKPAAKKPAAKKAARPAPERVPGRKERRGVVVGDAMDKTIVVRIDVTQKHEVYGKVVRRSSRLHAHDERNEAAVGDLVRVVETRPLSATKRWRLLEVLERAK
jgi:small subunit ribosomal protein S17